MNAPEGGMVVWWLEVGKALLLIVITTISGIVWRLLVKLRDDNRSIQREVTGVDGRNGLKSEMREVKAKLGELEDWLLVVDSVIKLRGMYDAQHEHIGEERRQAMERLLRGVRRTD
jgi:hypothetical protein